MGKASKAAARDSKGNKGSKVVASRPARTTRSLYRFRPVVLAVELLVVELLVAPVEDRPGSRAVKVSRR